MNRQISNQSTKPLRVMKFGGTSVGDPAAIRSVVEIVHAAARMSELVIVVSAMSSVTNQLLEAAQQAEAGNRGRVEATFRDLRLRHRSVISELIHSVQQCGRVNLAVEQLLEEGERLCEGTALLRELTPRVRDAISGLGERMSTPIVAAALNERGLSSQSIEATELICTDSNHAGAEPDLGRTRQLCHARLRPMLQDGMVPVVTGFIGANAEGVLTTLGRGGSDYSATTLGAVLDANEVTIWSDVDGLMTADPHLVPSASTIAEISYREAAELARFGAKVLHPKTLSPVAASGITIWIRNTFAPEHAGTRITPCGPRTEGEIKGLAVMNDAADSCAAVVTAVGGNMREPVTVSRILTSLARHSVNLISIPAANSELSFSFVVAKDDLEQALQAVHGEFQLERLDVPGSAERIPPSSETWIYAPAQGTASAD
jgi:bifunctional aspartokinase / homoserine dehydrogenase 1